MDWIELAQDRDRWRALTNVVMNLQVSSNVGNLTSWELVSFSKVSSIVAVAVAVVVLVVEVVVVVVVVVVVAAAAVAVVVNLALQLCLTTYTG